MTLPILRRPVQSKKPEFVESVRQIIETVKKEKDSALFRFSEKFDRVSLTSFKVTDQEIQTAVEQIEPEVLNALKKSIENVTLFHQAQLPQPIDLMTSPGVRCERRFFPIQRVGLYVPGGTAPLPSTVIMLGVPSKIAGCEARILCTPPQSNGSIDPSILGAAHLLGIRDIYKIGGAQAIAAMAFGTESIPSVDKIFGPGNSWVTEAKLQVSQDPEGAACDLPAGPSELMVIADQTANPRFVAADLLSQAEHGVDSQVILISNSNELIEQVQSELKRQIETLPRQKIAAEALKHSHFVKVSTLEDSLAICNSYAPEHLILQVENPRKLAQSVRNAGSVFLGPWTPESMGDYASGTNHTLPTYGFARSFSGLCTENFMKSISFQEISHDGLKELGPVVEKLAAIERLKAHQIAVQIRLEKDLFQC
jgi:histidinol dehydrogenase